jgi:hypothetical protein
MPQGRPNLRRKAMAIFAPLKTYQDNHGLLRTELRPQPTLADVLKALDTVNKNIHTLSQQVSNLEKDIHNVNNYTCQCANTIYGYLQDTIPTNYKEEVQWIHQTLSTVWTLSGEAASASRAILAG